MAESNGDESIRVITNTQLSRKSHYNLLSNPADGQTTTTASCAGKEIRKQNQSENKLIHNSHGDLPSLQNHSYQHPATSTLNLLAVTKF